MLHTWTAPKGAVFFLNSALRNHPILRRARYRFLLSGDLNHLSVDVDAGLDPASFCRGDPQENSSGEIQRKRAGDCLTAALRAGADAASGCFRDILALKYPVGTACTDAHRSDAAAPARGASRSSRHAAVHSLASGTGPLCGPADLRCLILSRRLASRAENAEARANMRGIRRERIGAGRSTQTGEEPFFRWARVDGER